MTSTPSSQPLFIPSKFIRATPESGLLNVKVSVKEHEGVEKVFIRQGKFEKSHSNLVFFPLTKLPEFVTMLEYVVMGGHGKSTMPLDEQLSIMVKLLERGGSGGVGVTFHHTNYGMDALSEVVLDIPMGKQLFDGVKEVLLKSKQLIKSGKEKPSEIPLNTPPLPSGGEGDTMPPPPPPPPSIPGTRRVALSDPPPPKGSSKGRKSKQAKVDKLPPPTLPMESLWDDETLLPNEMQF